MKTRHEIGASEECRAIFTQIDDHDVEVVGIGLPGAEVMASVMPLAEARNLWNYLRRHGFEAASVRPSDAEAADLLTLAYTRAGALIAEREARRRDEEGIASILASEAAAESAFGDTMGPGGPLEDW